MTDISKTERQLKSTGETPDLRGVIGEQDPEDVDLFGYQIIYTTGEFVLPREDLLAKMDDIGLPEWMAPSQVAPHRAFGRMISDLAEDGEEIEFGGHRIRFDIDSGDSRYEQHFHAKVWHHGDDDDVNATAGKWVDHELGIVRYADKDLEFVDRIDEENPLGQLWYGGIKSRARARFDRHQELHNGKDINNMVYYLARQWTDAVKLRDSCYFVPAAYEDIEAYIDGFRELYDWIDTEYKTRGQRTELYAINIVDSEREREMVERKVRDEVEDNLDDAFTTVVEELEEGVAADEVAERVADDVAEVEGFAERHSTVLKTELSVKRAMQDVLDDMKDAESEVVDRALGEAGIAPGMEA